MRDVAAVKAFERQAELGAELVERHFGRTRLFENGIGRPPHRRQIVHQRPRPIEYDVPNHRVSLWASWTGGNCRQRGGQSLSPETAASERMADSVPQQEPKSRRSRRPGEERVTGRTAGRAARAGGSEDFLKIGAFDNGRRTKHKSRRQIQLVFGRRFA